MSKKISLKQFLMQSGEFDRMADCEEAARQGKVKIDGKIATNPNFFFNPEKSLVKVNDKKIKRAPKLYFLLNKPRGYLSQKDKNEKSVYDIVNEIELPLTWFPTVSFAVNLIAWVPGVMFIVRFPKAEVGVPPNPFALEVILEIILSSK